MATIISFSLLFIQLIQASCPVLTPPQLCGSPDQVLTPSSECLSSGYKFNSMGPCCRLQEELPKKCEDPNAAACRSVEIGTAICPGNGNIECFQKDMSMKLYFEFQSSNSTCCSKCRCYGDPHCESFSGATDTWVICDARSPKPGNKKQCPMTQVMCNNQLDHLGLPCTWIKEGNEPWNIGLKGSPCRFNPSNTPPVMTLYKSEGVYPIQIELVMGERAIIQEAIIMDGAETYRLDAQNCFDYALNVTKAIPWRNGNNEIPNNSGWLARKWIWQPVDGGDLVWSVIGLAGKVDATIRCTRTPESVGGRVQYGAPRLNVDIQEPLNYLDPDQRVNPGGFCFDDIITKQGSTDHTNEIIQNQYCTNDVADLEIAQILCNANTNAAGVDGCKLRWCQENFGSSFQQQCIGEILNLGWDKAFCASVSFPICDPSNPNQVCKSGSSCDSDTRCRECVNYIKDNGWAAAKTSYSGTRPQGSDDGDCKKRSDMLLDLIGSCQKGVRVQYLDPTLGWTTRFAIPFPTVLCNGYLEITKQSDLPLFLYPMRIVQCGATPDCVFDVCKQEIGFSASVDVTIVESEAQRILDLFYGGLLECNRDLFPSGTGCLDFTPTPMCPCENRRLLEDLTGKSRYISASSKLRTHH